MGAPKTPAIIQTPTVSAKPTAAEKKAAQDALDQKKAALGKIRQDVFARSQGLRGAASMYDFAGRTPHLAGDPRAQPKPPSPPSPPPPPKVDPHYRTTDIPKGGVTGVVNDLYHPVFPADPNEGRGPRGDRDVGSRSLGGSPRNSGGVPGGPTANRLTGGAPTNSGETRTQVLSHDPITYAGSQPALAKKLANTKAAMGLTPKAQPDKPANSGIPTDLGAAGRAKLGLTPKASGGITTTPPTSRPADSYVRSPIYDAPTSPGIQALRVAAGLPAQKPNQAPDSVVQASRTAATTGQNYTPPKVVQGTPGTGTGGPTTAKPKSTVTQKPVTQPKPGQTVTQPKPGSIFAKPTTPATPAKPPPTIAVLPNTLGGGKTTVQPPPPKKTMINTGTSAVLSGRK